MFLALKRSMRFPVFEESLSKLPDQMAAVFSDEKNLIIKPSVKNIDKIVVNGMGGSNLGAEIIKSVWQNKLKIPLLIEPGYDLSGHVNKRTLYILSSYSGTTEEVLVAYEKAKKRGAQLLALTGDKNSTLFKKAEKDNISRFCFSTKTNPSNQPRAGLGLSLASFLLILKKLGVIKLADKEIKDLIKQVKKSNKDLKNNNSLIKNLAKKLSDKETILIGGPLFEGNLKTLRNQWCENAKNYASYLILSEMNHFAMEGLKYPSSNKKRLAALFFESNLNDKRINKRLDLTKEVIKKQNITVCSYSLVGSNALIQALVMLQLGGWLTYYLALENKVNPMEIPWVNWFKNKLSS